MKTGEILAIAASVALVGGLGYYVYSKEKEGGEGDSDPLKMQSNGGVTQKGTVQKDNFIPSVINHRDTVKVQLGGTTYLLNDSRIFTLDGYGYVPTNQERADLKQWVATNYPNKTKKTTLGSNGQPVTRLKNELLGNKVYLNAVGAWASSPVKY